MNLNNISSRKIFYWAIIIVFLCILRALYRLNTLTVRTYGSYNGEKICTAYDDELKMQTVLDENTKEVIYIKNNFENGENMQDVHNDNIRNGVVLNFSKREEIKLQSVNKDSIEEDILAKAFSNSSLNKETGPIILALNSSKLKDRSKLKNEVNDTMKVSTLAIPVNSAKPEYGLELQINTKKTTKQVTQPISIPTKPEDETKLPTKTDANTKKVPVNSPKKNENKFKFQNKTNNSAKEDKPAKPILSSPKLDDGLKLNIGINGTTKTYTNSSYAEKKKKHILLWCPATKIVPFKMLGSGNKRFIVSKCKHNNCYVTDKRNFFPNITQFDAVAFSGTHMFANHDMELPSQRSDKQKYVYINTESARNFRVLNSVYDGFFNWSWTYKLNSDVRWAYIKISDLQGRVVGPKTNMTWPELNPPSDAIKHLLKNKTKMAAWFVSHCNTISRREQFFEDLQIELVSKNYNWTVDVFGRCGSFQCPRNQSKECLTVLKRDYFFYFSFENSFAEDYVTEKLLTALNNNAVPVVFGGADYSRFLPPGSYLDARKLGVVKLAETMDAISKNRTAYYDFFRWQNHYRYKDTISSDVCNLCDALNDEEAMKKKTVHKDFRRWWNDEQ